MAMARYNEMIEIAQHICAHVILIDGSSLDEARKAREHGVDVYISREVVQVVPHRRRRLVDELIPRGC
jgi:hypothetical protein